MSSPEQKVNVRYIVDDVQAAIDFYTSRLGFTLRPSAAPVLAGVTRGHLRLLLASPGSSAGRPMPDGRPPEPGGRSAGPAAGTGCPDGAAGGTRAPDPGHLGQTWPDQSSIPHARRVAMPRAVWRTTARPLMPIAAAI
ncbi:MAG TPA: VOC family protein [Streptosporangiaceae bacterium]|nr:VOC family protein [Streptosporangiaceae bacterium]